MLQKRMETGKFDALLIAGPTASGKSAAALELAERLDGVVINADSMQVYRELKVLSARPSDADEARVPHRLYGHVPVTERYSAGRYQHEASEAINAVRQAGRLPIVTGGSGLYFGALEHGLSPIPPVPAAIKHRLAKQYDELGAEEFLALLARKDPGTASQLRPLDRQRAIRAAEVLEATGTPLSVWQEGKGHSPLNGLRVARFVLAPPRDIVTSRIDTRFRAMIDAGALDEAMALSGLDPSLPAARALGVPSLLAHLEGRMDLDAAITTAQAETRQYAKRQMTWFRTRMKDWTWVEEPELRNIIACIIVSMT